MQDYNIENIVKISTEIITLVVNITIRKSKIQSTIIEQKKKHAIKNKNNALKTFQKSKLQENFIYLNNSDQY